MKLDDSNEDYFLHDFSAEKQSGSPAPSESGDRSAPSFDFSQDGGSASLGSDPRHKAPKKRRRFMLWFFIIVALVLSCAIVIRYFVPYIVESRVTGYVTLVEKRGIVFPTFEGEMVSESQPADTTRIYSRDVSFSIPDDDLALRLQQYQGSGRPVTVTLERYYGTLPWRGASNTVAVDFQPADR